MSEELNTRIIIVDSYNYLNLIYTKIFSLSLKLLVMVLRPRA